VATLTQTLIDGHDIKLPGLGTFSLKDRAGRNPATGESLEIQTKRTVQFKVASGISLSRNDLMRQNDADCLK
jgi:nucleoid DNA-binding protein